MIRKPERTKKTSTSDIATSQEGNPGVIEGDEQHRDRAQTLDISSVRHAITPGRPRPEIGLETT